MRFQVKEDVKAKLTMASKGTSGGEGPRNHIQGIQTCFKQAFYSSY